MSMFFKSTLLLALSSFACVVAVHRMNDYYEGTAHRRTDFFPPTTDLVFHRLHHSQCPPVVAKQLTPIYRGECAGSNNISRTIHLGGLFALWYVLNIGHNVYSKKALNSVPLPLMIGAIQMCIGLFLFIPAWKTGILKIPNLKLKSVQNLIPMAAMHGMGHFFGVTSSCAGAISFVHIVKASEPLFTALGSAYFFNQLFPLPVYLTLLPVVIGVSVASVTELTFSWLSFNTAMISNICNAFRGIFAKSTMQSQEYQNLDALNLYNVLTAMAALVMVPLAWFLEGGQASAVWDQSMLAGVDPETFALHVVLSGLFHYLYNAVAFLALDNVHPVTHAVGNTLKRVAIIGVSMVVFKTRMTLLGTVGSAMAVGGTLLYSLVKQHYCNNNSSGRHQAGKTVSYNENETVDTVAHQRCGTTLAEHSHLPARVPTKKTR